MTKKRKKTIGKPLGPPQKPRKLKPSKLPPPSSVTSKAIHDWNLATRSGAKAWLEHRLNLRILHAANDARTNKDGKPSPARVPTKGTRRPKEVDSK